MPDSGLYMKPVLDRHCKPNGLLEPTLSFIVQLPTGFDCCFCQQTTEASLFSSYRLRDRVPIISASKAEDCYRSEKEEGLRRKVFRRHAYGSFPNPESETYVRTCGRLLCICKLTKSHFAYLSALCRREQRVGSLERYSEML